MNAHKGFLYGTHKFLPLFKQLDIKTPEIVAEDYSQTDFPFCYQIQTKLEGTDLGWVMDELSAEDLKHIAKDISDIFDKFKSLPRPRDFGGMSGANEEHRTSLWPGLQQQFADIRKRNAITRIQDDEILDMSEQLLRDYQAYFEQVQPMLYYDDICFKNVMIHE
ncbi:MAG: phosphotransferase, partial [Bacteroidota bacterium]